MPAVLTQSYLVLLWIIFKNQRLKKLVVLDTIYLPQERLIDKIEQISIAHLLGEAIVRIHEKRPLSPLFEIGKNNLRYMAGILDFWPLFYFISTIFFKKSNIHFERKTQIT